MFEVEGGKLSIADGWRRGPEFDKGARFVPGELGGVAEQLLVEAVPAQKAYGS